MNRERPDFATRVCGIPCGVIVDSYHSQAPFKGHAVLCDSDIDYYGYTEIEWHLLDRKGYPAAWIEMKMSEDDKDQLENEIMEKSNEQNY